MFPDTISPKVLLLAWLVSCLCCAVISFAATWAFFETAGAWRWPLD